MSTRFTCKLIHSNGCYVLLLQVMYFVSIVMDVSLLFEYLIRSTCISTFTLREPQLYNRNGPASVRGKYNGHRWTTKDAEIADISTQWLAVDVGLCRSIFFLCYCSYNNRYGTLNCSQVYKRINTKLVQRIAVWGAAWRTASFLFFIFAQLITKFCRLYF